MNAIKGVIHRTSVHDICNYTPGARHTNVCVTDLVNHIFIYSTKIPCPVVYFYDIMLRFEAVTEVLTQ